jgi:DNA-binding transcriptional LysR family regulator
MRWDERIGRRLRLRDLHTLQVIAEAGSMAKAADRLAVSQPAVSKAIADLEHTLGVPVLDRTPRGVEVTAYGRALLRHATAVFDDLRQGLAEIEFLRDPTQGELKVGAPEPIAPVLAVIINELQASMPKIRFQVMVGDTAVLYDALRGRQLDAALTRMPEVSADGDLAMEVLFADPLVVVAGAHNLWARRQSIDLADLVDQPWVLPPPDTVLGRFGAEIFRVRGLEPPHIAVVASSLQLRLSLMSGGPHLTLLPRAMLRVSGTHPTIVPIPLELPETERPVGLVRLKGRNMSPVLGTFLARAREVTSRMLTDPESI